MSIRNIVWTADRVKWLLLVGVVVMTAACGKSNGTSTLAPSYNPKLPDVFSLSGSILTETDEGAAAVEGALVEISRGEAIFEAFSDAEGWYYFDGLEAGGWSVRVEKDGYAPILADVNLPDSNSVDFMLVPMSE
jgi:carboxypeptidase family protein